MKKQTTVISACFLASMLISNLQAEPHVALMPSANPITPKVNIPLADNKGEKNIPVLFKDISGNKDKPYAGGNLAIINNQESNKPLPIKKKMPAKKLSGENKPSIDNQAKLSASLSNKSGLKIIEHGKLSTETFNISSSVSAVSAINNNIVETKSNSSNAKTKDEHKKISSKILTLPDSQNSMQQNQLINPNINDNQNLTIIELNREIDSLRKEIQDLKTQLKIKK